MRIHGLPFLVSALLLGILPVPLSAQTKTLRVGIYDNPPLASMGESNRPEGVYVDVLDAIASRQGWKLEYVPGTWLECLDRLGEGQIDALVAIAYSEQREKLYDFTRESILANWGQLYTHEDRQIDSLLDLAGKSVAVITGDYYYEEFRRLLGKLDIDCRFVVVADYPEVLRIVDAGKADAGLVARLYGVTHERNYKHIERSLIVIAPSELRLAFTKGRHAETIAAIDRELDRMKAESTSVYHKSLSRWLGEAPVERVPDWLLWVLGWVAVLAVLLALITLLFRVQLRRRTADLRHQRDLFARITETSPAGVRVLDRDGRIVFANAQAEKTLRLSRDEIASRFYNDPAWKLTALDGGPFPDEELPFSRVRRTLQPVWDIRHAIEAPDGQRIILSINAAPLFDKTGAFDGCVAAVTDITEQLRAETALRAANRALTVQSKCNEALVRSTDEPELLDKVCRAVVEAGGYRLAWVGLAELNEAKTVRPIAWAGQGTDYLRDLKISWADNEHGRGPTGTAIRTARPVACNDFQADPRHAPWHAAAAAMGFASSVALPLRSEGKAFGALNLYSADPGAFHEQEVELLQEMADNVTYGIQALRGKAQHALAEEALRRSEERFRQFFEDAPIGIEIYNAQGKLVDANRACLEIFGVPELSYVLGFDLFEDPNLPDGIKRDVRRGKAVRYEAVFDFDLVWTKNLYPTSRTGTISLSVLVTPLRRPEETAPDGYMVHVQDITARKQAEQQAMNLARFPAENPNPVLRVAETGTILYANPAGAVLLNAWSSGVGRPVPEDLRKCLADALVAGQREMLELHLDGRTFAITVAPIAEARYVNLYALDITDRKALEDQLRQSQKMEAVGQLAGGIAHDFNNQLTVMRGYCDLILREKEGRENVADWRHHAREIRGAVDRAATLTGQLLAFSRRQMLQPKVINLNEQLKAFSATLERIISENIRLVLNCQDDLWSTSVDPAHFDQAVMNLVLNARDAMPDGGQLTLETRNVELGEDYARRHPGMSPGQHVMIAVSDTGAGMSEETRRRAFEPFYTTKPQGQGSGLGLAMVYGFVKQSRGAVYLYSEPGKGTTFKIYLPRSEISLSPVAPSPKSSQQTLRGDETILLAEDDVGIRQLAVRILEQFGYTVLVTTSPQEALALANDSQRHIDLLITDVIMPGMSGPDLARNIGLARPDLEVLYVSGYTQNAILHHGIVDKDVNLLTKPFGPRELAEAVRRTLDRHKPSPPSGQSGGA